MCRRGGNKSQNVIGFADKNDIKPRTMASKATQNGEKTKFTRAILQFPK